MTWSAPPSLSPSAASRRLRRRPIWTRPHGVGAPDAADDYLRMAGGEHVWLRGRRVETANTHGTGCSLSSAVACGLAQGFSVDVAVREAKAYVAGALGAGLDLGRGSGPLNHMWRYGQPPC